MHHRHGATGAAAVLVAPTEGVTDLVVDQVAAVVEQLALPGGGALRASASR